MVPRNSVPRATWNGEIEQQAAVLVMRRLHPLTEPARANTPIDICSHAWPGAIG